MLGYKPMVLLLLFIVFYFAGLLMMYYGDYLINLKKEVNMPDNNKSENNSNEPIGKMFLYTKDVSVEIAAWGLLT